MTTIRPRPAATGPASIPADHPTDPRVLARVLQGLRDLDRRTDRAPAPRAPEDGADTPDDDVAVPLPRRRGATQA